MHPADWRLINGENLEALPSALVRARGNAVARRLAQSDWLIRRKGDGRFIAARSGDTLHPFLRGALTPAVVTELALLAEADAMGEQPRPLHGLLHGLHALGLDDSYGETTGLALVAEPCTLAFAGRDRYGRPLWLSRGASRAWRAMRQHAATDDVTLEAISGYRSHAYQMGIFRRKLQRGLAIEEILGVNAAPGYSEHHSGNALDIGTPGEPAAEESFEATQAFAWLAQHAGEHGMRMSYPRDNVHGIVYEPWHWYWHAAAVSDEA